MVATTLAISAKLNLALVTKVTVYGTIGDVTSVPSVFPREDRKDCGPVSRLDSLVLAPGKEDCTSMEALFRVVDPIGRSGGIQGTQVSDTGEPSFADAIYHLGLELAESVLPMDEGDDDPVEQS